MTRKVAGLVQFFWPGRRSSVVEQLTRNEQVIGSSPIAGSSYGWEAPQGASILIPLSLGERVWVRGLLVFTEVGSLDVKFRLGRSAAIGSRGLWRPTATVRVRSPAPDIVGRRRKA